MPYEFGDNFQNEANDTNRLVLLSVALVGPGRQLLTSKFDFRQLLPQSNHVKIRQMEVLKKNIISNYLVTRISPFTEFNRF